MSITVLSKWEIPVQDVFGLTPGIHVGRVSLYGPYLILDTELETEYYTERDVFLTAATAWKVRNCDIQYNGRLYYLLPVVGGFELVRDQGYSSIKPDWVVRMDDHRYWFESSQPGLLMRGVIHFGHN